MVVIAIDFDSKLYGRVKSAVETGNYSSLQEFLEAAAWNQLALEDSVETSPGSLTSRRAVGKADRGDAKPGSNGVSGEWKAMVKRVEGLNPADRLEPTVVDDLLWGQTNRVLPIAVGVRVLAQLANEAGAPVARDIWYEAATETARRLREELKAWDREAGRKRGELWATAFPADDEGSGQRYVHQFLGVPRKNGLPEGGAAFLGFVAFEGSHDSSPVHLTTSGAEWATLENPIFDGEHPASTFSDDETRFFLDHLHRYRPAEYGLLATVASLVDQGHTRTEIDSELADAYPAWSKYIETMRAGAIGRLSDLGLLTRTRRGLEVDYHLTPLAAKLGLPDREQEVQA